MGRQTGTEALAALAEERVDHRFKGLPPEADGLTVAELAAQRRNLFRAADGFTTPVLALSAERLEHNLALMETYTVRHGLAFAPHGKTSMAPQLFQRQIEHGAWGITLAVPHQVRVARAFGVRRIFLANELVDASALRWIAAELAADPEFRFVCYVDSVRGVELMDAALRGSGRPVDVVVELGAGDGARTGVRTEAECLAVAAAVAGAPTLRLVGVAGYEGEVPEADPQRVAAYLRRLTALAAELDKAGRFADAEEIVVSAGGSAWFDTVAEVFGEVPALSLPVLKLLRSGAYVSHDDGHYRRLTPFARVPEEGALEPAFRLWAEVVSRPAPGQAFANAGKRDAAYDLDLPTAQVLRRDGAERPATGVTVTGLSDQHTWLRTGPEADVEVGDWIGFGLSHPCTSFDKWQLIPVAEADGTVVDYIRTFF
ncbi:D-serine deaminase, pyridoxal phosphate-dependent [Streptomyces sp. 1222.5]|uniref:amino acid deaminase n=1 Tax=unclassified Streptomyces TaxID=2593676 RepID=UPI000897A08E|nr:MULTISPECIES: amino acid deaminase [unclassified Streptomyces]PKW09746.1 D-serine deaminase-like pyridoxal phosphate-dependent protein [Streptomyces sp. 5112.2]SEC26078.1 D-serine deaminase, pyridoxal phosphate-dependent [Streptomyces sp. 1222.5]